MLHPPNCYIWGCKHYKGIAQPEGTEVRERCVCDAFPEGIPEAIAYGKDLHLIAVPGDHGIIFEQGEMDIQ